MGWMSDTAVRIAKATMEKLKVHINDYCDLETTQDNSFVATDGSLATVVRYDGFKSLVSKQAFAHFIEELTDAFQPYLSKRTYKMQVVFMRDDDASDEIDRILSPSYETAARMQMEIYDILDEKKAVHKRFCMEENVYLVLWTRPGVQDPVERAQAAEQKRELSQAGKVPGMLTSQNILRPIAGLEQQHNGYVESILNAIKRLQGSASVIELHQAFCDMKRMVYKPNTPSDWRPIFNGDEGMIMPFKKKGSKTDLSAMIAPRLDDQFFVAPGRPVRNEDGKETDTRAVRLSSRIYAPVFVKIPHTRLVSFASLFSNMNEAVTVEKVGNRAKQIPWSMSFTLEGDGMSVKALTKIFAAVMRPLSPVNRAISKAFNNLAHYKDSGGTIVAMQITAMTWSSYGDEKELMQRRSKLARNLAQWGGITTEEETGDPLEAVLSCVPALSLNSPAPTSAPPLGFALYGLPLARPVSPFNRGTTVFRSLDGKLLPYEVFSDQQNTWCTLLCGGPGSGKSVLANRLNEEMCLLAGMTRLPYLGVIDFGVSSSGFIALIRDSLPEGQKHLANYIRLQNNSLNVMNQLDTTPGNRFPLQREKEYMRNFFVSMATPPGRAQPHRYMSPFVEAVITKAFMNVSDVMPDDEPNDRGRPKLYSPSSNKAVALAVEQARIQHNEDTTWWQIEDALFDAGKHHESMLAHRYAMPTMNDLLSVANEAELVKEYAEAIDEGISVVKEFNLMINAAQGMYQMFSGSTNFDVGSARVVALDLQDVVPTGSSPEAAKQASLMFMMALNAFMSKVAIIKEDIPFCNRKYRAHLLRRAIELEEDYKRLFIDEYHLAKNNTMLTDSVLLYGRTSRKWKLELQLASQFPRDFGELTKVATTVMILNHTEETRKDLTEVFGMSQTEIQALIKYVHGPVPGQGATFLAKIKTKDADLTQLFTSTVGPRELWALSTTAEDRGVRQKLYQEVPGIDARDLLAREFASGSCKSYVMNELQKMKDVSGGDGFIEEEANLSIYDQIVKRLVAKWKIESVEKMKS
jgi:intracellular multiplication protein IcmB